jgi:succinate dehydrogenase / fumarate reductase iron-sulfur subunit
MGSERSKTIVVRIRRQERPGAAPQWQEFEVPYQPNVNVIVLLTAIRENPVERSGRPTSPVAWEANCLEEVCGACSMVINGRPRQACTALVDQLTQPITIEPMATFPVIRDLMVDRERMFTALKQVQAWIPIDGTHNLGPGPRVGAEEQEIAYKLSTCMTCGCCVEACPQVTPWNKFIGAAAISQARLFGLHPTGALNQVDRLAGVAGPDGIQGCGNAQNCVEVCPKEIPLTESIAAVNRQLTARGIFGLLRR